MLTSDVNVVDALIEIKEQTARIEQRQEEFINRIVKIEKDVSPLKSALNRLQGVAVFLAGLGTIAGLVKLFTSH